MNIYVGNLSFEVTEEELYREFAVFGVVSSISIMNNKYIGSGQLKGYGFVEMTSQKEAEIAVDSLNGKRLKNQVITVVRALPLTNKKDTAATQGKGISFFNTKFRQRVK